MNDRTSTFVVGIAILLCAIFGTLIAVYQPGYLSDVRLLGGLIFLQMLAALLWSYRQRFFLALIVAFLWAGTAVPLKGAWTTGRWFVLAAGALAGIVIYLKDQNHHFGFFHLVAFCCVLMAVVSALVSAYPRMALLKAISLLLLFLYAAAGARLAVIGREAKFLAGLVLGCEILVYLSAFAYFVLHLELYGNRNSLGVVMGVVALPFLLWGLFISGQQTIRWRRAFALLLCVLLLLASYERAGIGAAVISSSLLCFGLRQYRVFIKGLAVAVAAAVFVAAFVHRPEAPASEDTSVASIFLYKGKPEAGLLGSRKPVWDETMDSLRAHPWFGTGFGTSATDFDKSDVSASYASAQQTTREHGNSYLAILEWVGYLGVAPFLLLLLLLLLDVGRVVLWMRRTGNAFSPVVPLAVFVVGALAHAGFEDWLFAVGYHTCVFFWALAFIFVDFVPALSYHGATANPQYAPRLWDEKLGVAVPSR